MPEPGAFLGIKHPNLRLALCGLFAASLLSACGGGSSSSSAEAGGADSRTYQQGYAAGTAATLDIVLADLRALQISLAGPAAPAQTSRGTLGRSFALLEPRQRETLAASLLAFIARVTEARDAASAPTAGADEAAAAQRAADEALRALQLVIEADTASRASGDETARQAAVTALNQINQMDVTTPEARTQVDAALNNALQAARTEVAELERQLAAARAALGQQEGTTAETIARLQARLSAARNNLDDLTVEFGDGSAPRRPAAAVRFEPRMTGMTVTPAAGYDPYAGWQADLWTAVATSDAAYREVSASFREGSGRIQLEPSPVLYSAADKSVVSSDPHLGHFPARGLIIRATAASLQVNAQGRNPDGYFAAPLHRLRIQGRRLRRSTDGNDNPLWGNWNATAHTTFRYDRANGLTMGFGGDGVIFSDLEQYVAKGGDCPYLAGAPMEPCDDAVAGDIEISFGAPSGRDPVVEAGEPGTYYWRVQGEDPRILTAANEADAAVKAKQAEAYADYELVLSNYAGKRTAAGAHRFLRHAAYGLFVFTDKIYDVTGAAGAGILPGRTQAFHYGKDAFGTGRQVSGVESEITAKFEGRTHGYILHGRSSNPPKTNVVNLDARHTRIRGDVKLTANIGGSSPTNTVTGTIENLEHAIGGGRWTDEHGSYWYERDWDHDNNAGTDAVKLHSIMKGAINLSASIDADGAFAGTATPGDFIDGRDRGSGVTPPAVWEAGEFEGGLYGPLNNLEAAGVWWVPAAWGYRGAEAMVGSFGAVCTESSNGGAGACATPASP